MDDDHKNNFDFCITSGDDINLFNLRECSVNAKPFVIEILVNDMPMEFQIDSGSSETCISEIIFFLLFIFMRTRNILKNNGFTIR